MLDRKSIVDRLESLERVVADLARRVSDLESWRDNLKLPQVKKKRVDTGELKQKVLLADILANFFSQEELYDITFRIGLYPEHIASKTSTLPAYAWELIHAAINNGRLDLLYQTVKEKRPFLFDNE
ncbi:MAG: hypothetical protein D6706_20990 [Chloroflexi bacterium]|nr:MAG: hypothetical protein D6706_20990 [Chloroflexota bacterium]